MHEKGVDIVHTFGFIPGRTVLALLRIPHVFAGSQCLQAPEDSSSPTSGTAYPLVRGAFALTCVQSLRWGASDAIGGGLEPSCRGAYAGVWGGGVSVLAGGRSAC